MLDGGVQALGEPRLDDSHISRLERLSGAVAGLVRSTIACDRMCRINRHVSIVEGGKVILKVETCAKSTLPPIR